MSELKLVISQSSSYKNTFDDIVSWLNNAESFKWTCRSLVCDNPVDSTSDEELKQRLTNKIEECNALIVVSRIYDQYSKWVDYEIEEALRLNKPIIGLKHRENEDTPTKISNNAKYLVEYNEKSLIEAVEKLA